MLLAIMYHAAFGLGALMGALLIWAGIMRLGGLSNPGSTGGRLAGIIWATLGLAAGIALAGYSAVGFWRQINHSD